MLTAPTFLALPFQCKMPAYFTGGFVFVSTSVPIVMIFIKNTRENSL